MRTMSLSQLHERALVVLEMIGKLEGRIACFPGRIRSIRKDWMDERNARIEEHNYEIAKLAYARLVTHYGRTLDRINAVVVKSLTAKTATA